jgi:hypothetical protein
MKGDNDKWRLVTPTGKIHKCKAFKYQCVKGEI